MSKSRRKLVSSERKHAERSLVEGEARLRILVVDDTPANLHLLTEILTEHGYRVRSAANGRPALPSAAIEVAEGNIQSQQGIALSTEITGRKRDEQEIRRLNTELLRKVEQLQNAQEELVRKEKLSILGQLAGSVGHELRNPLGVMSNAVYFLTMFMTEADQTVREYLGIIKEEISNSQRIIADLLDFARTRAPLQRPTTVPELVSESLGKCAIPESVTVSVDLPESLPRLNVDPLQVGQVMLNFITNAVQAMPQGGALSVSARHLREPRGGPAIMPVTDRHSPIADRDFVEISVGDTGEGISPEGMKKLFQPLFTTKPKGIGLGLVVCRNLVDANGGKIEVESVKGGGATFTMVLPAVGGES